MSRTKIQLKQVCLIQPGVGNISALILSQWDKWPGSYWKKCWFFIKHSYKRWQTFFKESFKSIYFQTSPVIHSDRIYWSMCIFLCSSWVLAASVLHTGAVAASQNNLFHQRRRRPSSSQQRSSILMKMSHTWAQHTHQVCLSLTGVLASAVV